MDLVVTITLLAVVMCDVVVFWTYETASPIEQNISF
jgi:hypothetical protein